MKMERNLAYWKARKIDIKNCIAMTRRCSPYWADLWHSYRFAETKVNKLELKSGITNTK